MSSAADLVAGSRSTSSRSRARSQADRRSGKARLEPAKKTSGTTSTGRSIATCFQASLSNGKIAAWTHRVTGSSNPGALAAAGLPERASTGMPSTARPIFRTTSQTCVSSMCARSRPHADGFWRGVGPNNNVFAVECFIDELAKKAGQGSGRISPRHARRTTRDFKCSARTRGKQSRLGEPLPARVGRGIAAQTSFGSFIATVDRGRGGRQTETYDVQEVSSRLSTPASQ